MSTERGITRHNKIKHKHSHQGLMRQPSRRTPQNMTNYTVIVYNKNESEKITHKHLKRMIIIMFQEINRWKWPSKHTKQLIDIKVQKEYKRGNVKKKKTKVVEKDIEATQTNVP